MRHHRRRRRASPCRNPSVRWTAADAAEVHRSGDAAPSPAPGTPRRRSARHRHGAHPARRPRPAVWRFSTPGDPRRRGSRARGSPGGVAIDCGPPSGGSPRRGRPAAPWGGTIAGERSHTPSGARRWSTCDVTATAAAPRRARTPPRGRLRLTHRLSAVPERQPGEGPRDLRPRRRSTGRREGGERATRTRVTVGRPCLAGGGVTAAGNLRHPGRAAAPGPSRRPAPPPGPGPAARASRRCGRRATSPSPRSASVPRPVRRWTGHGPAA